MAITFMNGPDAGTNRIINVVDPVNAQDAATKHYVDSKIGVVTVTASATPVFSGATGTVFQYTMAQNVTSSTYSNVTPGQVYVFEIIQSATTAYTFVWPTTMINTSPISIVLGKKSVQLAVCLSTSSLLCIGPITYI